MNDRLAQIIRAKHAEVAERKDRRRLKEIEAAARGAEPVRGFADALARKAEKGFALIAEIKRASPSKGLIREDFEPAAHARAYRAGGAACLSVLTDEKFFQGHADYLGEARAACDLPALRKDFMVDPWQVPEARAMGADAILIIVAALDDVRMREIELAAIEHGMDVLVEVHNEAELERALNLHSNLIGINNRDLKTFETRLETSERLAELVPDDRMVIAESGIGSHGDIERLAKSGIRAFLVGESLMRQADVEAATRALLEGA